MDVLSFSYVAIVIIMTDRMMPEDDEQRIFSLHEARSLLPTIALLISRMVREYRVLANLSEEVERARNNADLGGGTPIGDAYLRHLVRFSDAAGKVQRLGVLIKDAQTGLIDFPYELDGRIIYLCWRLGEEDIDWWHEVESGFAGRQPLTDDFR